MSFEYLVGVPLSDLLSDLLKVAAAALLSSAIVYGKKFLPRLLDTLSKRVGIDRDKLRNDEITGVVKRAVAYVEQRYVRKQKGLEDFDETEAFDKAVTLAKSMMSKEALAFIT